MKTKEEIAEYKHQWYIKNKERRKELEKKYRNEHKEEIRQYRKKYYQEHKEEISQKVKEYCEINKEKIKEKQKERRNDPIQKERRSEYKKRYNRENKEDISQKGKQYYLENRDRILHRSKEYSNVHKDQISQYGKKRKKQFALYDVWFSKLLPYYDDLNELQRDPHDLNLLQVRCKYCGKWMNPNIGQVERRICAINGSVSGDQDFYCSKGCKNACPKFNARKYPKGFSPATSREVQPELRKMVLERDNWTCQKCGRSKEENPELELHCHHIDPVVNNPIESTDMDNCVTLCKECHKFVHSEIPGCKLGNLIKCGKNKNI